MPNKIYYANEKENVPIDIEIMKKLEIGQGGQGAVYKIKIKNQPGFFVDKKPTSKCTSMHQALDLGNILYQEFMIGQ